MKDHWHVKKTLTRQHRASRREAATAEFPVALALAKANGLSLRRCNDSHYQLAFGRQWLINIYPGNARLWHDPHRKGPFLRVEEWSLVNVVRAAIERLND